jgi:uncharacterized UBP type Zn finger protein
MLTAAIWQLCIPHVYDCPSVDSLKETVLCAAAKWYDLTAVIVHKGVDFATGHFVTDVIRSTSTDLWTRYDDSIVLDQRPRSEFSEEWSTDGYIFAFTRRDVV